MDLERRACSELNRILSHNCAGVVRESHLPTDNILLMVRLTKFMHPIDALPNGELLYQLTDEGHIEALKTHTKFSH
jgi:hypothetical protein